MTTARLTYNSIDIDFIYGAKVWQPECQQVYNSARSTSGIIERINGAGYIETNVELFFDNDVNDQLYTWWWSWGRLGSQFSFAIDYSNVSSTTLDGAANSGQKVIPLTATTGLVAGDRCVILTDSDEEREVITIASVSAGVSVTAVSNLRTSFASGDAFRHFDYYPALVSDDGTFSPQPTAGNEFYTLTAKWVEVL